MWLSAEHLATMPPGTRPYFGEECEYYGCNEEGGLGPDLRVHCLRYVDRADPSPPRPVEAGLGRHVHAAGPSARLAASRLAGRASARIPARPA